jgi:hypothetical protein
MNVQSNFTLNVWSPVKLDINYNYNHGNKRDLFKRMLTFQSVTASRPLAVTAKYAGQSMSVITFVRSVPSIRFHRTMHFDLKSMTANLPSDSSQCPTGWLRWFSSSTGGHIVPRSEPSDAEKIRKLLVPSSVMTILS